MPRRISKFIEKAGLAGVMPDIKACGSRETTFDRFMTRAETGKGTILLLVDSEKMVRAPATSADPWRHLRDHDRWSRPKGVTDDNCHLMVQFMETWFLADMDALEKFYGGDFRKATLPQNPKIEEVPKQDIEKRLKQASRNTSKGEYSKGKHSFEILAILDPAKVRCKSPYVDRFLRTLEQQS